MPLGDIQHSLGVHKSLGCVSSKLSDLPKKRKCLPTVAFTGIFLCLYFTSKAYHRKLCAYF